jgi:hypothetical protein
VITGSFGEPSKAALIYGTLATAAVNGLFKRMWKGALMVYFNSSFQYLSRRYTKASAGQPISVV